MKLASISSTNGRLNNTDRSADTLTVGPHARGTPADVRQAKTGRHDLPAAVSVVFLACVGAANRSVAGVLPPLSALHPGAQSLAMTTELPLAAGADFLWEPSLGRQTMVPERFDSEQREIARTAREFSDQEIMPHVAEIEAKQPGLIPALLRKAGELGLLMVDIPPEFGGLGLDKTTSMLIAEQFSRVGSFAVSLGAHTGIGTMPILYFGSAEQKARYLPDLATGKRLAAYALTEPGSGSDALAAKTRADRSADGSHYVINGSKQFITNAGFADVFTVFAQIDGNLFSAFIVDRNTPGLEVGPEEHKLGIRGSSTCPLSFENMKVPASHL